MEADAGIDEALVRGSLMAQLQGAELALAAAMLAGAATAFVAPAPALLQVVGAPARVTLSGRPATGLTPRRGARPKLSASAAADAATVPARATRTWHCRYK